MKLLFRQIFIGWLLLAACGLKSQTNQSTPVSEADVNRLGEYLAGWAEKHCTVIWIDDNPVLIEDGNAGGCSAVWWQHPEGLAFVERGDEMPEAIRPGAEQWHLQNMAVKTYLSNLLSQSDCDFDNLLSNVSHFSQETNQVEVADQLSCLGKVDFVPVERGIE
jgi:hypothetical protein